MRKMRVVTLLGAAAVVIGSIAGVAYAQGMGMGNSGMMSMSAMMTRMQKVMGETTLMMNHAQSQGMMDEGMMHGQSGTMPHNQAMMPGSQEMMGMVQGTDSMAHTMNGLMQNMHTMMNDPKLAKNPAFAEHLESMQRSMSTMMQGFDGFVDDVNALQEQQSSN